jgi:predicted amidohydrolase YtcJ
VVLERDLFAVPVREIGAVPVTLTVFNGAIVYERGAAAAPADASE